MVLKSIPNKKLKSGFQMPVLGLGTWGIGGKFESDHTKDQQCIEILRAGINSGLTFIDTAESYARGHTEELVGQAIQRFNRKKLFISTKVSSYNLGHHNLISSAKASLKRMKLSYIDLYMLHDFNPAIPLKETMRAMDFLVKKGLVRHIGLSKFSVPQIKMAQSYTNNKIVAVEVEYNLLRRNDSDGCRNVESEIIPYCEKTNILVIAYQPIDRGVLASPPLFKKEEPGFKLLDDLSRKYKKTPAQIALNWLLSKKQVVTVFKTTNVEHLKENSGAFGWKMALKDSSKLDRDFKTTIKPRVYSQIQTLELDLISRGKLNELFYKVKKRSLIDAKKLFNFFDYFSEYTTIDSVLLRGIGEPILHPDFKKIINYFRDKDIKVTIFTFPGRIKEYTKLLGIGGGKIEYGIYSYPYQGYQKDITDFYKLVYRFGNSKPLIKFSHFYLVDKKSQSGLKAFIREKQKRGETINIIRLLGLKGGISQREFLKAQKVILDLGVPQNINWVNGRDKKGRCSYFRRLRMFVNSKNQVAFCHFLPHLDQGKIVKLDQLLSANEIFSVYKKCYQQRRAGGLDEKNKSIQILSPCDYCRRYLLK